jgi:hypothetical protein
VDWDWKVGDDGIEGEDGESVARKRALSVEAPRREWKEAARVGVVAAVADVVVGAARDVVRTGIWMWRGGARVLSGDVVMVDCGGGGGGAWSGCFCSVAEAAGLKDFITLSISDCISSSRESVVGVGTGGRCGKAGAGRYGR